MSESFDFSGFQLIDIEVKGPDGHPYILREATGAVAKQFKNAQMSCTQFSADGKMAGVKGAADLEPLLVSKCLYRMMPDGTVGGTIDQRELEKWPAKVVSRLFEKAKKISGLSDSGSAWAVALEKALNLEGSPITAASLKNFLDKLTGSDFEVLKDFGSGEELKNLSSSTTGGSE